VCVCEMYIAVAGPLMCGHKHMADMCVLHSHVCVECILLWQGPVCLGRNIWRVCACFIGVCVECI
jgi:hypothetical protein